MQESKPNGMLEFLKNENDYITYLLEAFEVPETINNDSEEEELLLDVPRKKMKLMTKREGAPAETVTELQERADVIKKKFEQRKATRKNTNRTERKKLKQQKLLNKQKAINREKMLSNEMQKQERGVKKVHVKEDPDQPDDKQQSQKVYNKEGKLFFSKVLIDGEKKKKVADTNPRANLQKLNAQKKKIQELVGSGDKLKAKEEKQKILWKAAFEKTEGLKVKDNPEILKKTIKKRKVEKKKSKEEWGNRKKKVEEKQAAASKKREDNLNKRKTDNQKIKLKKAVNKGRIIKGVSG